jgi:hypothetical protein
LHFLSILGAILHNHLSRQCESDVRLYPTPFLNLLLPSFIMRLQEPEKRAHRQEHDLPEICVQNTSLQAALKNLTTLYENDRSIVAPSSFQMADCVLRANRSPPIIPSNGRR